MTDSQERNIWDLLGDVNGDPPADFVTKNCADTCDKRTPRPIEIELSEGCQESEPSTESQSPLKSPSQPTKCIRRQKQKTCNDPIRRTVDKSKLVKMPSLDALRQKLKLANNNSRSRTTKSHQVSGALKLTPKKSSVRHPGRNNTSSLKSVKRSPRRGSTVGTESAVKEDSLLARARGLLKNVPIPVPASNNTSAANIGEDTIVKSLPNVSLYNGKTTNTQIPEVTSGDHVQISERGQSPLQDDSLTDSENHCIALKNVSQANDPDLSEQTGAEKDILQDLNSTSTPTSKLRKFHNSTSSFTNESDEAHDELVITGLSSNRTDVVERLKQTSNLAAESLNFRSYSGKETTSISNDSKSDGASYSSYPMLHDSISHKDTKDPGSSDVTDIYAVDDGANIDMIDLNSERGDYAMDDDPTTVGLNNLNSDLQNISDVCVSAQSLERTSSSNNDNAKLTKKVLLSNNVSNKSELIKYQTPTRAIQSHSQSFNTSNSGYSFFTISNGSIHEPKPERRACHSAANSKQSRKNRILNLPDRDVISGTSGLVMECQQQSVSSSGESKKKVATGRVVPIVHSNTCNPESKGSRKESFPLDLTNYRSDNDKSVENEDIYSKTSQEVNTPLDLTVPLDLSMKRNRKRSAEGHVASIEKQTYSQTLLASSVCDSWDDKLLMPSFTHPDSKNAFNRVVQVSPVKPHVRGHPILSDSKLGNTSSPSSVPQLDLNAARNLFRNSQIHGGVGKRNLKSASVRKQQEHQNIHSNPVERHTITSHQHKPITDSNLHIITSLQSRNSASALSFHSAGLSSAMKAESTGTHSNKDSLSRNKIRPQTAKAVTSSKVTRLSDKKPARNASMTCPRPLVIDPGVLVDHRRSGPDIATAAFSGAWSCGSQTMLNTSSNGASLTLSGCANSTFTKPTYSVGADTTCSSSAKVMQSVSTYVYQNSLAAPLHVDIRDDYRKQARMAPPTAEVRPYNASVSEFHSGAEVMSCGENRSNSDTDSKNIVTCPRMKVALPDVHENKIKEHAEEVTTLSSPPMPILSPYGPESAHTTPPVHQRRQINFTTPSPPPIANTVPEPDRSGTDRSDDCLIVTCPAPTQRILPPASHEEEHQSQSQSHTISNTPSVMKTSQGAPKLTGDLSKHSLRPDQHGHFRYLPSVSDQMSNRTVLPEIEPELLSLDNISSKSDTFSQRFSLSELAKSAPDVPNQKRLTDSETVPKTTVISDRETSLVNRISKDKRRSRMKCVNGFVASTEPGSQSSPVRTLQSSISDTSSRCSTDVTCSTSVECSISTSRLGNTTVPTSCVNDSPSVNAPFINISDQSNESCEINDLYMSRKLLNKFKLEEKSKPISENCPVVDMDTKPVELSKRGQFTDRSTEVIPKNEGSECEIIRVEKPVASPSLTRKPERMTTIFPTPPGPEVSSTPSPTHSKILATSSLEISSTPSPSRSKTPFSLAPFKPTTKLSKRVLKKHNRQFYSQLAFNYKLPQTDNAKPKMDIFQTRYYRSYVLGKSNRCEDGISASFRRKSYSVGKLTEDNWKEKLFLYKTKHLKMPKSLVYVPSKVSKDFVIPSYGTDVNSSASLNAVVLKIGGRCGLAYTPGEKTTTRKNNSKIYKEFIAKAQNELRKQRQPEGQCQNEFISVKPKKVRKSDSWIPPECADKEPETNFSSSAEKTEQRLKTSNKADCYKTMRRNTIVDKAGEKEKGETFKLEQKCSEASTCSSVNKTSVNRIPQQAEIISDEEDVQLICVEPPKKICTGHSLANSTDTLHISADLTNSPKVLLDSRLLNEQAEIGKTRRKRKMHSLRLTPRKQNHRKCNQRNRNLKKRRKKCSMLDQLANTDGYIAEKRTSISTDLFADPTKLNREERALQRAMMMFTKMEMEPENRRKRKRVSHTRRKARQLKKRAIKSTNSADNRRRRQGYEDFKPQLLSSRTRYQSSAFRGSRFFGRYHRDAAYEEALDLEETRRMRIREQRQAKDQSENKNIVGSVAEPTDPGSSKSPGELEHPDSTTIPSFSVPVWKRWGWRRVPRQGARRRPVGDGDTIKRRRRVKVLPEPEVDDDNKPKSGSKPHLDIPEDGESTKRKRRRRKDPDTEITDGTKRKRRLRNVPGQEVDDSWQRKRRPKVVPQIETGSGINETDDIQGTAVKNGSELDVSQSDLEMDCDLPPPVVEIDLDEPYPEGTLLPPETLPSPARFEGHLIPPEVKKLSVLRDTGETILHKAARQGYEEVTRFCCETKYTDPNAQDHAGYTALHESCATGHMTIAKCLLQYCIDVNVASRTDGVRPIHDAVENDHIEMARLLLSWGADPTLSTFSGKTVFKMARSREMKEFLQDYFLDLNGPSKMQTEQPWILPVVDEDVDEELGLDLTNAVPDAVRSPDAEICFEMAESKDMAPLYCLSLDPNHGKRNYTLLSYLLNYLNISKQDLLQNCDGLEIMSVPWLVAKQQLTRSKLSGDNASLPEVSACEDLLELVEYNEVVRHLLGVDVAWIENREIDISSNSHFETALSSDLSYTSRKPSTDMSSISKHGVIHGSAFNSNVSCSDIDDKQTRVHAETNTGKQFSVTGTDYIARNAFYYNNCSVQEKAQSPWIRGQSRAFNKDNTEGRTVCTSELSHNEIVKCTRSGMGSSRTDVIAKDVHCLENYNDCRDRMNRHEGRCVDATENSSECALKIAEVCSLSSSEAVNVFGEGVDAPNIPSP